MFRSPSTPHTNTLPPYLQSCRTRWEPPPPPLPLGGETRETSGALPQTRSALSIAYAIFPHITRSTAYSLACNDVRIILKVNSNPLPKCYSSAFRFLLPLLKFRRMRSSTIVYRTTLYMLRSVFQWVDRFVSVLQVPPYFNSGHLTGTVGYFSGTYSASRLSNNPLHFPYCFIALYVVSGWSLLNERAQLYIIHTN